LIPRELYFRHFSCFWFHIGAKICLRISGKVYIAVIVLYIRKEHDNEKTKKLTFKHSVLINQLFVNLEVIYYPHK